MPINHEEIIEEIEGHIRKFGGAFGEWCVGTAKDSRGPFFRRHLAADLGDGLIYREAFTTSAADQVMDHLVNACGLRPDRDSAPEPGKIVFVYHQARETGYGARDTGLGVGDSELGIRDSGKVGAAAPAPPGDQAAIPRRAA